ncbi:MAG: zinc ABC transporter substrate-binding protein [Chloroflexota bacterium]|nr:zinc ABC transporter substrate-binding protein [Chloroflexota bacterium]
MLRIAIALALLAALGVFIGVASRRESCAFGTRFAQLQAQVPDVVGACVEDEQYRPELGQATQRTTAGTLAWDSLDGVARFSNGTHTWVLDPGGQVLLRPDNERFGFEFNGDGFPEVGQPLPDVGGPCPTTPLAVLVVENFYANLVQQLGGQCVTVTTILFNPDADPHQFEPTVDDVRAFQGAELVVENGLGYDDFADRVLATISDKPPLVRAGDVVGLHVGANPHLWYGPEYVEQITAALSSSLKELRPDGAPYFERQAAALDRAFGTYRQLVARIAEEFTGTPIGATESLFLEMAEATGLRVLTPTGFLRAGEDSAPTAGDMAEFQDQLASRQVKVLVYNTQTVTPTTERLKALAIDNDIPVVGVSETLPAGARTFQGWQAAQLRRVHNALRQAAGV